MADMTPPVEYLVSVSALCKDPHLVSRVAEVFARAGAGIALEGLSISINITELEVQPEGVDENP